MSETGVVMMTTVDSDAQVETLCRVLLEERLRSLEPMTDERAFDEAERLVGRLGDKYSRILGPTAAAKLNKFDVTGVGLNLIIAESGEMRVGAVPAPDTTAAAAGIRYGERVLRLNGQATAGMSSFDALEAIQGDGDRVEVEVQAPGAEARTLSLLKAYQVKNPLSKRLLTLDDGSRLGYLKLTEFNAQCNRRMRVALRELERDGRLWPRLERTRTSPIRQLVTCLGERSAFCRRVVVRLVEPSPVLRRNPACWALL